MAIGIFVSFFDQAKNEKRIIVLHLTKKEKNSLLNKNSILDLICQVQNFLPIPDLIYLA